MNKKEISEIRRRARRDRSTMTAIHGCYVNDQKEVVSKFRRSTATMSENEAEKYFLIFKRSLLGTVGKNLVDLTFRTSQVTDGQEHALLMKLRETELKDDALLDELYEKIIAGLPNGAAYLILIGCELYDVPFKNKNGDTDSDASDETFKYLLCAICPVKQAKPTLHYVPEEKEFRDGGIVNAATNPEIGFMFPAFDDRAANIYNALFYTHNGKENYECFITSVFATAYPKPAEEQKHSFQELLASTLEEECSIAVVQTVDNEFRQRIDLHKECRISEPLTISKSEVSKILSDCGVSEKALARFRVAYDDAFGTDAEIQPVNLVNERMFSIETADVHIRVDPSRTDLIETRVIGGIKYILIAADDAVEVNGIPVHIGDNNY